MKIPYILLSKYNVTSFYALPEIKSLRIQGRVDKVRRGRLKTLIGLLYLVFGVFPKLLFRKGRGRKSKFSLNSFVLDLDKKESNEFLTTFFLTFLARESLLQSFNVTFNKNKVTIPLKSFKHFIEADNLYSNKGFIFNDLDKNVNLELIVFFSKDNPARNKNLLRLLNVPVNV